MQVHCPGPESISPDDVTSVDHVKLFRNHRELKFNFRIHEQLLPSIRRLEGRVEWTDIFVVHSGSDHSPDGRQRKYERDLRILALELQERPDHPFVLFNLGMTHEDMGSYAEATHFLQRCLEVSDAGESHVRKAYALLMSAYCKLNQFDEAQRVCELGREVFPDDVELAFRHGMLAHATGRLEDAERAYVAALENREPRHFSSLDPGVFGYKARHNLALVYRAMRRPDLAEGQCRQAVIDAPRYGPTRRLLIDLLFEQKRLEAAEIEIEKVGEVDQLRADAVLMGADVAERKGDLSRARRLLEEALSVDPNSTSFLDRLCQHLFHHGNFEDAERSLLMLIDREPNDGVTRCNLGNLYLSVGKLDSAEEWFRDSLRLRPRSATAWKQLANVLAARGNKEGAKQALAEVQCVESVN